MVVALRGVRDEDLPLFFEHQLDPDATAMAAFPARDRDAFMAHWARIRRDETVILRSVLCEELVVGNVVSWENNGERYVGYWIAKEYWSKGIASAALASFLGEVTTRPLHARVARHNVASRRVLEKCGFAVSGEATGGDVEELLLLLDGG